MLNQLSGQPTAPPHRHIKLITTGRRLGVEGRVRLGGSDWQKPPAGPSPRGGWALQTPHGLAGRSHFGAWTSSVPGGREGAVIVLYVVVSLMIKEAELLFLCMLAAWKS